MWYVYVMKSEMNGRYYTGSTNDLERRWDEYDSGKSTYTRLTRPFRLIFQESYTTRLEARRRESFYKTGKGREVLKTKLDS